MLDRLKFPLWLLTEYLAWTWSTSTLGFFCLFVLLLLLLLLFVCFFLLFFNQAALRLWILYGRKYFDDKFVFICKVLLSAYSTEVWRMWLKCLVPKQKGMFTLHSKHHSVWYFTVQEGGVPSLILTSTKKIGVLHVIQIRWKIRFPTGSDPFW